MDIPSDHDTPDDGLHRFDVVHNPGGPWETMNDQNVKNAIVRMATEVYRSRTIKESYPDFLDQFTLAWHELCVKVEDMSRKHGFRPCVDLSHLSPGDQLRVALLALTINGSFVLLGNGCLRHPGSSGMYERIPLREGHAPDNIRARSGVVCVTQPSVGEKFVFDARNFLGSTSPIHLLFYTTDTIPRGDAERLERALTDSVSEFHTRVFSHYATETVRENPPELPQPERKRDVEEPVATY